MIVPLWFYWSFLLNQEDIETLNLSKFWEKWLLNAWPWVRELYETHNSGNIMEEEIERMFVVEDGKKRCETVSSG